MKGDTRAFIGELTHISPAGIVTLSNALSLQLKNTRDSLNYLVRLSEAVKARDLMTGVGRPAVLQH